MAKTRLRAMKHIMYFAAFLVLTACGGGESRGTTTSVPAAPTPTVHLAAMGGVMNVLEVDVLTPNPTAANPISFQIHATFTGTLNPGASSFEVPVVMGRTDATTASTGASAQGILAFVLTSGTTSSGTWTGSGVVTMPPQPIGEHTFNAAAMPNAVFDFLGSWSSGVSGTISIAP